MSTQVQSVIFDKSKYSVNEAKKWLRDNGFVAPKVDKTDRYLRFRQKEPSYFDESSFRTIPFGKGKGIKAIIGVPMKYNPFFDSSDVDGSGHRIGAYAMLFTKAKDAYNALVKKKAGGSAKAKEELAKAKYYWDMYQVARQEYKTVEERDGIDPLLHEFESFENAMKRKLPKRNNPMKTHKNPVIEGKTLVENIKGLQALVDKMVKSKTDYGIEDFENAILDVLSKLNIFGVVAKGIRYFPSSGGTYIISLFQSSMGYISLSIHAKSKHQVSAKINYIDESIYGSGMYGAISGEMPLLEAIQDAFGRQERLDHADFQRLSNLIAEKVVQLTDLKGYAYIVDGMEYGLDELLTQKDMRMNPHCHCYGSKKNPHCPVHGRKKNPYGTAYMAGLAYRYNPPKKIMDFESFMDNLNDGNVFVGRYVIFVQDGVPMRLEVGSSTPKEVSPEVAFYADLAGQAELVGTSDIDAFSDNYRGLIRQASDASSGGVVAGGALPVVEVEEVVGGKNTIDQRVQELVSNISETITVHMLSRDDLPNMMRLLEEMKSYIKEWKQEDLPMTQEARRVFSEYIPQALDPMETSKENILSYLLEIVERPTENRRQFQIALDNIEIIIKIDAPTFAKAKDERSLNRIDDKLKESLKKFTSHFDPKEKRILDKIREIAGNKRIKTSASITKAILEKFKSIVEKYTGSKVQFVDKETGEKTTPKKEAQKIVEEAKEEVVAPTPAPAPAQEVDPLAAQLAAMAKQQSDFIGGFKKNPRGSHYAYRMSTLDHDHRMDYVPLNNVYIKKNPSDAFRLPQTKVLGVDIDNDIYTWLSNSLPNWDSIIPLLTGAYAKYKATVETLANQAKEFMVSMQTEIVPAVEDKVRKQLASGKTLREITGEAKKNPRHLRRNTKRRRRY